MIVKPIKSRVKFMHQYFFASSILTCCCTTGYIKLLLLCFRHFLIQSSFYYSTEINQNSRSIIKQPAANYSYSCWATPCDHLSCECDLVHAGAVLSHREASRRQLTWRPVLCLWVACSHCSSARETRSFLPVIGTEPLGNRGLWC